MIDITSIIFGALNGAIAMSAVFSTYDYLKGRIQEATLFAVYAIFFMLVSDHFK